MNCVACGSAALKEWPERTAQGYRRFRCRACGKQFNERSGGVLNHTQFPSDVIALVVLWRLRYKLSLRDLSEMFLLRGIVFSYEAVRAWEAKLTPALAETLRRRRRSKVGRSWHVDETEILSANSAGCSGGGGDRGAERNDPVADRPHTALRRRFCPGPKPTQPGPANSPTVSDYPPF